MAHLFSLPHGLSCRDTARLIIRKVQYAPTQVAAGPKADICKNFMMSDKPVHIEASLDKDVQWQSLTLVFFPYGARCWLL